MQIKADYKMLGKKIRIAINIPTGILNFIEKVFA